MPEIDDVVRAVLADTPRMTDESFATGRERVLARINGESFESGQEHVPAGIGDESFDTGRERASTGMTDENFETSRERALTGTTESFETSRERTSTGTTDENFETGREHGLTGTTDEGFTAGRERVLARINGESFESGQEHVPAGIGDESFETGRERVLAGVSGGAGRGRVRSRRRLIGIAAGVVALVAAALIVPGGEQEVSAATVLNRAADVIQASDVRLATGQFRYFRMETVRVSSTQRCQYRERDVDEVWIPQGQEAEWLLKRNRGQIEWVTCADPGAGTLPRKFQEERRAKYGTFDEDPASEPGWYNLTPQFLNALPRDPQAFYALIQQEYAKTAEPSKAYFQHATYLLQRAALTADLRATLYRAMALIPGVEITEEFATVDGRKGTAIGLSMGSTKDIRDDVVINPADGTLIGRRSVGPDGTVAGWDVITHGVAPGLGEPPIG